MYDAIKTGEFIKFIRKTRNITQAELADDICTREMISRIESGHIKNVSYYILARIANRLNVGIDELLGFEEGTGEDSLLRDSVEDMIFNDDKLEDLKVSLNGDKDNRYLNTLAIAFSHYRNNELDKLYEVVDRYFTDRTINYVSLNDLRLIVNKMKAQFNDENIDYDILLENGEIIITITLALMRLKPDRNATTWINTALVVADVARLYGKQDIALDLLNICEKVVCERHMWQYKAEVETIKAGIKLEAGDYSAAMPCVLEAEKIYSLFGNTRKIMFVQYLKEVVKQIQKLAQEEVAYTEEEIEKEIRLIREKFERKN